MNDYNDDNILFEQVRTRNSEDAYSTLYLRYYYALTAYAALYVGMAEANDVVQGVFLNLWRRRSLITSQSIAAFLFTSTRNGCLNLIKHNRHKYKMMSDVKLSLLDAATDNTIHNMDELLVLIRQTLSEFPYEFRRTFEMSRFEGKSYQEIAREMNVSVKTVEYRISKVLRRLEVSLTDYLPIIPALFTFLFS